VLFVCENNGYSTHTPLGVRQPTDTQIWERVRSYSIPAALVDGNDVFAVHAATTTAVAHVRAGHGPYFLECTTYRWREHVGPLWDYDRGYRSKAEVDAWIARCPIERARRELVERRVCTAAEIDAWRPEHQAEVGEAIARARAASFPAVTDLLLGTY
jgi:TPP-dependent pyruvate/acetoin dehydrogenase alpha subunit